MKENTFQNHGSYIKKKKVWLNKLKIGTITRSNSNKIQNLKKKVKKREEKERETYK